MFLPVTRIEMEQRNWDRPDFVIVTGDAYVDHHSFGTAIIGRLLERFGYKVAVLPRPDYRSSDDFKRFGRPRLGFLINSGAVDSMVNNYTVFKRKRKVDQYAPGGEAGGRPDRAVIVYANRAREAYKDVPVIIGGIEASLRRFGHYDYWDDKVRRSILLDSKADLLIYGMGERAILEIAEALDSGLSIKDVTWIRGTSYVTGDLRDDPETIVLPEFREITGEGEAYARSFMIQHRESDSISGRRLAEPYENGRYVVQNPPQPPLERQELDDVYELPYENAPHPIYEGKGEIPGFSEVRFSIVSSRGCFGGCNFCALTYHQGRQVRSRSLESIVREAEGLTRNKDFKGYIHDVGGPTANFRNPACDKQLKAGVCKDKECLFPELCRSLKVDHRDYLEVLRAVRNLPKVKKVFVKSGIRYDYMMADPDDTFFRELVEHHISGTLKVAPEHVSKRVLGCMGKPDIGVFEKFSRKYYRLNEKAGKKQFLIPYLISSHPGSTLDDAAALALYLKEYGFVPDQVQDFYPTPGTLSTCMYHTGLDPRTMEPVYVAKTIEEKSLQRALIHFNKKENRRKVEEALDRAGRPELKEVLLGVGKKNNGKTGRTAKSNRRREKRSSGTVGNKGRKSNSGRRGRRG